MIFNKLALEGAFKIDLELREDNRGFFSRMFCSNEFNEKGINTNWVQINNSYTRVAGTVRGLHLQKAPMQEAKLIRCFRGSVWDVIVDMREESKSFCKWVAVELNEKNRSMIYVPPGFAHGFQTLEPDTELVYFHSNFYSPENETGIPHNDPVLNIPWRLPVVGLSTRDANFPKLKI